MKKMCQIVVLMVFLLSLAQSGLLQSGEESESKNEVQAQVSFKKLQKELKAAEQAFNQEYRPKRGATQESIRIYREKMLDPEVSPYLVYAEKYEIFAEKNPGTTAALEARIWCLQVLTLDKENSEEDILKYCDKILKEFSDHEKLTLLVDQSRIIPKDRQAEFMDKIRKASTHESVQAKATYMKCRILSAQDDREAAEEAMNDLKKNFADIKHNNFTYGELAEAYNREPHAPDSLKVGEKAPEIIGKDVDGNEMKLSDYKGKVVFLDFWGWW